MKNIDILSKVALTFINADDFETQVNVALHIIGKHLDVSRMYAFLDNEDGTAARNICEWCNKGIMPQIDELQNLSYETIPSWKKILLQEGQIYSENIYELPKDILAVLGPKNIVSIIVYPIFVNQEIKGFVGFDDYKPNRKWKDIELGMLRTISGIISSAYERKLFHDQTVASKNNFQAFFESVDDLFMICTTEGRIIHANQAVTKKLGYSLAELKKMNIIELHPKDKRAEAMKNLQLMFNGELQYCPLELEDSDGNRLPVENRIWFGQWDNQECVFGISKDLSKEQEALQKFTKVFENNPAPMVISSQGEFIEVNSAFLNKFGYSKEEVIGKTMFDIGLVVDFEKYNQAVNELRNTGRLKDIEMNVKCKDEKILNGLFSGEIIENQGQKNFLTVMVDVTELTLLSQRIDGERKRLENIIQGTGMGTWE